MVFKPTFELGLMSLHFTPALPVTELVQICPPKTRHAFYKDAKARLEGWLGAS